MADVEEGSGDILAELCLSQIVKRLAKADRAIHIATIVRRGSLSQSRAARILTIAPPKLLRFLRGQLSGFSVNEVTHFLRLTDCVVETIESQHAKRMVHR